MQKALSGEEGPSEGQQVSSSLTGRAGEGQGRLIPLSLQNYAGWWPRAARGGCLQLDKLLKHCVLIGMTWAPVYLTKAF